MNTDKENVIRTLKEEPLLASNWCRFNIHRWRKYSKPAHVRYGLTDALVQERYCDSCNLVHRKTIKKW